MNFRHINTNNNADRDAHTMCCRKCNAVKMIGKILFSGVVAFAILECLCYFYYNPPIHHTSLDGATDYVWESSQSYSDYTEGAGRGKTNNEGYLNPFDYRENMLIDILIMGSSHMEAFQLEQQESAAGQLRLLLPNSTVYNLGVSAHAFLTCAANLDAAISKYQPRQCVVLETNKISFSAQELSDVLNGEIAELTSHSDGVAALLMQSNFVRLLVKQAKSFLRMEDEAQADARNANTNAQQSSEEVRGLWRRMLSRMKNSADRVGADLIILYHPSLLIDADGTVASTSNRDIVKDFSALCEEAGILFLDMTERFLQEYGENHLLPHGFPGSSMGEGHLNRYGHRMIAEELSYLIGEE